MEEILPEVVLSWDQTGIKLVRCSSWIMEQRGANTVEVIRTNDTRQITAVFCGSLVGDFLTLQVNYAAKTARCHPSYNSPSEWNITHSRKHGNKRLCWSTSL